jgi:ABC-type glycerol-3-phosphate transport system substrate-binding protein
MKRLHRRDLFCWSEFAARLDIDFNSFAWIREGGNVLIDPLPMSEHDRKHLRELGGAAWIIVTNSSHVRGTQEIAAEFGAKIAGPEAEREGPSDVVAGWLGGAGSAFLAAALLYKPARAAADSEVVKKTEEAAHQTGTSFPATSR